MIYGCCIDAKKPLYSASLALLHDVLGKTPFLRMSSSTADLFPASTVSNFDALDAQIEKVVEAGFGIYFNPTELPAWATGGKAAYTAGISGSSCAVLAQWNVPKTLWEHLYSLMQTTEDTKQQNVIKTSLDGVQGLTNNTTSIAWHFIKNYKAELEHTWAWNNPEKPDGGIHVWGDSTFVEQDKLSAPRPYLLSAATIPHADPGAVNYIFETLIARYLNVCNMIGYGNEPDIALFNPLILFDGVNGGNGGDIIKDRLIPEIYEPFLRSIYEAGVKSRPQVIGPDVAYPGTLARMYTAFEEAGLIHSLNVLSFHCYGDGWRWPEGSYEHAKQYSTYLKDHKKTGLITEIDGVNITQWLRTILSLNLGFSGITFLEPTRFVSGFYEGTPELTSEGIELKKITSPLTTFKRRVVKH